MDIKEVKKQPHNLSLLDKTLISHYKIIGKKEEQEVRYRFKELDI